VPGAVLELGAGPESILAPDTVAARPVLVADVAFEALRRAPLWPGAVAVCLDAARPLPVGDGSCVAVVMGELIEHVYNPRALLRECRRVLHPSGVLVVTTPNLANLQDRLRFLAGRAPRHVDPLHPYLWLHIRPFTASLFERVLRDSAFRMVALRSNHVVWEFPSGRSWKSRALAMAVPGLGGSLIVLAEPM
jgi:SAM-dependent methyltransferase